MSRECELCGKTKTAGRTYTYRGLPKYKGGIGLKVTGKTKRVFRPNVQKVRAVINGTVQRITVCTKCIKSGKIVKPMKPQRTKPE